jgi:hypothetical protein
MSDPKEGFYFNGTTYTPCKLLAAYDFKNMVRLLIGKSKIIMVEAKDFVEKKPVSDHQIKLQAKRTQREAAQAQKEMQDANSKTETT